MTIARRGLVYSARACLSGKEGAGEISVPARLNVRVERSKPSAPLQFVPLFFFALLSDGLPFHTASVNYRVLVPDCLWTQECELSVDYADTYQGTRRPRSMTVCVWNPERDGK